MGRDGENKREEKKEKEKEEEKKKKKKCLQANRLKFLFESSDLGLQARLKAI